MAIKVDVRTNINDYELTLEKCSEIITLLQDAYQNIRNDMYARFLSTRILIKTLTVVAFLIVLYLLHYRFSKESLLLYLISFYLKKS